MSADPSANQSPAQPQPAGSGFFQSIRRAGLWRAPDRWLGGVCGGLAARLGWDPLLVRGLFIFLALITGGGGALVLYGAAWLLLPEAADGRIHLEQVIKGDWSAGLWGGAILVFLGLTGGATWSVFHPGLGVLTALVLAGVVIAALVVAANRSNQAPVTPPWVNQPAANATAAPGTASTEPQPTASSSFDATQPMPSPQGSFNPSPPPVYARPAWTAPPPPPRRRAGGPVSLALLGLMILALAGVVAMDRYTTRLHSWLTPGLAVGVIMVVMGLGLVVLGLLGRRAGGFIAVSIILAVLAAPIAATADAIRAGGGRLTVGERNFTPRSFQPDNLIYGLSIGKMTIDLTELQVPKGRTAEVDVSLSMGQANVILPSQTPIEVNVQVDAGAVSTHGLSPGWQIDDNAGGDASVVTARQDLWNDIWNRSAEGLQGLGVDVTILSSSALSAQPSIVVNITTSMGQVELIEVPHWTGGPPAPVKPVEPVEPPV